MRFRLYGIIALLMIILSPVVFSIPESAWDFYAITTPYYYDPYLDLVRSGNFTGENLSADYIFGNGSSLTSIAAELTLHTLNGTNHTDNLSSNRVVKDTGTNWLDKLLDFILDDIWDRDKSINDSGVKVDWDNVTYDSELAARDLRNGTQVNESITKHNESIKSYVDVNFMPRTEIDNNDFYNGTEVNNSIEDHNASIKSYVDDRIVNLNESAKLWVFNGTLYIGSLIDSYIVDNVTGANTSMRSFVITTNASMRLFVITTNISMKAYVDVNFPTSVEITNRDLYNGTFVNSSITKHNASQTAYTDSRDVIYNDSMVVHDESTNDSIKSYIDVNYPSNSELATNITGLNESVKEYVYNGTLEENITKQSCTATQKVSSYTDGTFTCTADVDSNASTSCGVDTYLDGNGLCINFNTTVERITVTINNRPTSFNVSTGTCDEGCDVSNVSVMKDGASMNISEVGGASPLTVRFNFTGVLDINDIILRTFYSAGSGHQIAIGLYDYTDNTYHEDHGFIESQSEFETVIIDVIDGPDHISNGVASLQLRHVQNGNANHDLFIDYVELTDGFTSIVTHDHDALSGRGMEDSNHPWSADIRTSIIDNVTLLNGQVLNRSNVGGENITLDANGKLAMNISCETFTGSAELCDGDDDTGAAVDWTVIQNYTPSSVGCPAGEVVVARWQNGTFNCTTDATSAFDPSTLGYVNHTQLNNGTIILSHNTSFVRKLLSGGANITYTVGTGIIAVATGLITDLTNTFNQLYTTIEGLVNETIIRSNNATWIYTVAPHTNLTDEASYALTPHTNATGFLINTTDSNFTTTFVDYLKFHNDTSHSIESNQSCIIIKGDTVELHIC